MANNDQFSNFDEVRDFGRLCKKNKWNFTFDSLYIQ